MKISVSLPAGDVEFLDAYAQENSFGSRSATVLHAIRLLRSSRLEGAYADAWQEWTDSGDADAWELTVRDGLAER